MLRCSWINWPEFVLFHDWIVWFNRHSNVPCECWSYLRPCIFFLDSIWFGLVWIDTLRKRKYPKCGKGEITTKKKTFTLVTSCPCWYIWRGREAMGIFVFLKKQNIEWMWFHSIPFHFKSKVLINFNSYTTINTLEYYLNIEYYTNNEQRTTWYTLDK